jgi:copper(I)-binding protein
MTPLNVSALAALFLLSTPALAAPCAFGQTFSKGAITVTGAYLRATLKGAASAGGYLTIANSGASPDSLTGISSDAAAGVAVHQMKMDGNMMEMSAVDALSIPAGGAVALDPMGYHLMLTGFPKPFAEGDCVSMTLHFAQAGDLPVTFNVGGFAQDAPPTAPASGVSDMSSGTTDMSSMAMGM